MPKTPEKIHTPHFRTDAKPLPFVKCESAVGKSNGPTARLHESDLPERALVAVSGTRSGMATYSKWQRRWRGGLFRLVWIAETRTFANSQEPISVEREVSVEHGHIGRAGRLDLLPHYDRGMGWTFRRRRRH